MKVNQFDNLVQGVEVKKVLISSYRRGDSYNVCTKYQYHCIKTSCIHTTRKLILMSFILIHGWKTLIWVRSYISPSPRKILSFGLSNRSYNIFIFKVNFHSNLPFFLSIDTLLLRFATLISVRHVLFILFIVDNQGMVIHIHSNV